MVYEASNERNKELFELIKIPLKDESLVTCANAAKKIYDILNGVKLTENINPYLL